MEEDLGGREPPLERRGSLPPNLPLSPRTSPMSPPLTKRKFVSLFESGGDMGEVFVVLGGMNLLQSAAVALLWRVGCIRIINLTREPNAFHPSIGCEAALFKANLLPPEIKTSPKSTRPKQSERNFRHAKAGALGGSSREVREVWRVGPPLRKRGSCASKVFLTSSRQHSLYGA